MSHGFYLSLVFTFLFLLQSLNNDENKFKSTLSTCSTLGRNLTLGNSVFIAKYQELDFLLHPNLFYHRSIECLTNNRTNPLEYKPLLCRYNWNFASIQSANEYSLRRKFKRSKCKVNYYPVLHSILYYKETWYLNWILGHQTMEKVHLFDLIVSCDAHSQHSQRIHHTRMAAWIDHLTTTTGSLWLFRTVSITHVTLIVQEFVQGSAYYPTISLLTPATVQDPWRSRVPRNPASTDANSHRNCKQITIAHLNAESVKNRIHFVEIQEMARNNNFDILSFSET